MPSETNIAMYKAEQLRKGEAINNMYALLPQLKMAIEDGLPSEINKFLGIMQAENNRALSSFSFMSGIEFAENNK